MGEIVFIRHGQASFGMGDYDMLSERGVEQAAILARYLAASGIVFDSAYSGTLKRQVDTAGLVFGILKEEGKAKVPWLRRNENLNEYHSEEIMRHYVPILASEDASLLPLLEKIFTEKKSFQLIFERVMARWISGESGSDSVESWEEFRGRVDSSIKEIINENERGSRVAVFSSGGVISAAVQIATGMSPYEAIRAGWGLVNASVTKFRYGSSGLILHSFNSYQYLELNNSKDFLTYR